MTTVREPRQQAAKKHAADLKRGDFVASGAFAGTPVEILLAEPFTKERTLVVYRGPLDSEPIVERVISNTPYRLATDAEVKATRDAIERARQIDQIRQLADWFESNPWVPMPWTLRAAESLSVPADAPTMEAAIAKVRVVAQRLGVEVNEKSEQHTSMEFRLGDFVEYTLSAYHPKGRPTDGYEPEADTDPTGLRYSRADDEGDDGADAVVLTPKGREILSVAPVSPARVPMHVGVVDDEDNQPVDEPVFLVDHGPVKPPYGTPERAAYDQANGL